MRSRAITLGIVAVALAATLAGCSSNGSSDGTASGTATPTASTDAEQSAQPGTDTQQVPPIMADVGTINGTTQTIPMGNVFVLTGDTDPVTDWAADISPSGIVEFTPGRNDGSATYNPGLKPVAAGTATVTLTNSASGASVTFTAVVD